MLSEKAVFIWKKEEADYWEKQMEMLNRIAKKMEMKTKETAWIWEETYDVTRMTMWSW